MKQEMVSYLDSIKDDISQIIKYIHDNPEEAFKEKKASEHLINIFEKNGFKIQRSLEGIETAFKASFGSGHPKICFLCEYDSDAKLGPINGNNITAAISTASALMLKEVLPKLKGSIIVIGCPGEFVHGTKEILSKGGVFEDIDAVFICHPHTHNIETEVTKAILTLKLTFKTTDKNCSHTSLDIALICINTFLMLIKNNKNNYSIEDLSISSKESILSIEASSLKEAYELRDKFELLVSAISSISNQKYTLTLNKLPCESLLTNSTISRLFAHNLKESGIIEVSPPENLNCGSSIGCLSHTIPCIHPFISITKDANLKLYTKEFADATVTSYALEQTFKAAEAMAFTSLDLIEKEDLLREAKIETSKSPSCCEVES